MSLKQINQAKPNEIPIVSKIILPVIILQLVSKHVRLVYFKSFNIEALGEYHTQCNIIAEGFFYIIIFRFIYLAFRFS